MMIILTGCCVVVQQVSMDRKHCHNRLIYDNRSFQFSAANDWNKLQKSLKLESYISISNFRHQLSDQRTITVPVHSQSVNSTPNYLIPILLLTLLLFYTPVSLLAHHHLHIYHSSIMLNCNYFASMAY